MPGYIKTRTLLLFVPALFVSFCLQAQKTSFVIKGTITGADGKTITLLNAADSKRESAFIIRNQQFELKTTADNLSIFALKLEDAAAPLLVVNTENDTVELRSSLERFPVAEIKGNKQSVAMQKYQQEFFPLMQQAQRINQQASAINENDSLAVADLQQKADAFNRQMKSVGLAFIQYHPDALASIFVIMNEIQVMAPLRLQQLFGTLSAEVKNSPFGQMASMQINMMAATAIGAHAPAFTLNDTKGNPVSLSSYRGKYVLIDFWASWCGPCRAENPNVVRAYNEYKNKNFTILGVSLDKSKASWLDAIRQDGLEWTQVSDLGGWNNTAAQLYHVSTIPTNFLIDPSGKIIAKNLRGAALENMLAKIFP